METQIIPVQIRFRDIDMNHHVNNAVYFTYMENARTALLVDDMLKCLNDGLQFVVAEANCRYLKPILLDDTIICEVSFKPVRPTSCDINYQFRNKKTNVIHAEGTTRMVLFNSINKRPIAIPEWFTAKYLLP